MAQDPDQRIEFPVTDALTAINLATAFKSKGYTIFRGQRADWKLTPTLHRNGINKKSATERFRLFAEWVHQQPELRELHYNYDAVIAVAQHHGFKTPFLDFTRDPAVAAYFAIEAGRSSEGNNSKSCAIACINPDHAKEAWEPYNQQQLEQGKQPLLRLVDIDVKNLWRLQAQSGLFLDVHVDHSLFHEITPVIYIVFPTSAQVIRSQFPEIFPSNKSPLEAVLDQFFAEEHARIRLEQKVRQLEQAGEDPSRMWAAVDTELRQLFVGARMPPNAPSWTAVDNSPWLISPRQDLDDEFGYPEIGIGIDAEQPASRIWQVTRANILAQIDRWRGRGIVKWRATLRSTTSADVQIDMIGHRTDEPAINAALSQMYDGMRWLPYSDEQIVHALAAYVCLATRREEYEKQLGRLVAIELVAGLVTSSCLVGHLPFRQAFRDDLQQYLTAETRDTMSASGYHNMVSALPYPRKLFDFEKLVDLFATQIIPSQIIHSADFSGIVFNPAKLDLLCLADVPEHSGNRT